ncbi:MAG: DSD1 family PLP-dependent enzyme [Dongiaceae bacterium]
MTHPSAIERPAPVAIGASLAEVETPALLVDLDAFDRNLTAMARYAREGGIRLRPHGKTHKCVSIARLQVESGAIGLCCQKPAEAEAFAAGGIKDLLVTNEVVAPAKLRRLARLTAQARIGICVDNRDAVEALKSASAEASGPIDVYLELDVGAARCGVDNAADALRLLDAVSAGDRLRFAGIQAYQGGAQHLRQPAERRAAIDVALRLLAAVVVALKARGVDPGVITGGGTGTFPFETSSGAYDEIQPGSYVFMDRDYGDNLWPQDAPRFEQSLFLLTGVMSRRARWAVVDAGHKTHSIDSGMPVVAGRADLAYDNPSDEHGIIRAADLDALPRLGERLRLVPGHCDPTVNLWDWIIGIRGDRVEAVWPIEARGGSS